MFFTEPHDLERPESLSAVRNLSESDIMAYVGSIHHKIITTLTNMVYQSLYLL